LTTLNFRTRLFVLTVLLLLIASSRAFRLDVDVTEMRVDEVWSAWQTFGTGQDVVRWTPYDWPPGYYLSLAAWREMVGVHPVVLRWLSVLTFMVGASAVYCVGRRLKDDGAGVLSMLAYGALGYLIFLSTEVRGYAPLLGLMPLALWLTMRYFSRPRLVRALPLALVLAAMFYTSMTSAGAILMLLLYSLFTYGRQVWRWWLPGALALIIALPELINKSRVALGRLDATGGLSLPPVFEAVQDIYRTYAGNAFLVWLLLFSAATALLLFRRRVPREVMGLLLWCVMPIVLYFSNPLVGFFQARYSWWVMLGIALWVGWGLSYLPKLGRVGAAGLLAALMFVPLPLNVYQITGPPLGKTFQWLSERAQWGDVLLLDPNCECIGDEELDYFTRVYFPRGLAYVDEPAGYRRIWYMTGRNRERDLAAEVEAGRIRGDFYGPGNAMVQLYEAPPDVDGVLFENGMRFHGADILNANGGVALHEGETIRLRLWWSVDEPPTLDYSVALKVFDRSGSTIASDDSAPQVTDAPTATSQWTPGRFYVEERAITLRYPMRTGTYRLGVVVYFWQDLTPIPAPGVDDEGALPVRTLHVKAW
jgi:hypothetical protein